MNPKLASIQTPRIEMGNIAAELLLKRINGEKIDQKVIDLPVEYVEGESL